MFDIDKMYMMFPHFEKVDGKLKYIEYNYSKSANEQSKDALQNRLIELYKAVLTQEDVLKDVMNPIDIEFIKDDIIDLFPEQPDGNLIHFDAFKDIKLKYEFSAGKAGVGQEANAVVDINRLGKISLNNVYLGWGHSINNKGYETEFDREYSVSLSDSDLEYYLSHINRNRKPEDYVKASDIKKVKIGDSLTAILNAFVDIAKDPYITRGNWVTNTTNTGNMLIRAGMHPLYVTAFMAQPIIRQYIDYTSNNESKTVDNTGDMKFKFMKTFVLDSLKSEEVLFDGKIVKLKPLYDALVSGNTMELLEYVNPVSIAKQFGRKYDKLSIEDKERIDIIKDKLLEAHREFFEQDRLDITKQSLKRLREQINNPEADVQQSVLFKFFELQDLSKNLRQNVDISKVDTNGHGKNINSMFIIDNLKNLLINNEAEDIDGSIQGFNSKLENEDGSLTTLGAYYKNSITKNIKLVESNPQLFPQAHPKVQETFNYISRNIYGNDLLDAELGDILEKQYYSYVMSKFEPFNFSKEETASLLNNTVKEFVSFRDTGNNEQNYLILQELELKQGDTALKFLGLNNRKKSAEFEEEFTNSWRDLFKVNPDLANNLVKYAFLTSGFQMNKNQFFTYIPNEWLVENGFNNFIKEYNKNLYNEDFKDEFIDIMFLNNVKSGKLVPNMFPNKVAPLSGQEGIASGFMMKESGRARFFVKIKGKTETLTDGTEAQNPDAIYKLMGYTSDGKGLYTRVTKLGLNDSKGNKVYEADTTTLFTKNKIKIVPAEVTATFDRSYYLEKDNTDNIINESIEESPSLWNDYSNKIQEKYPGFTQQEFDSLSFEEQDRIIKCL